MKYDFSLVKEKIDYYKDKAFNLKDKDILLLMIDDLTETVLELERELDNEVFDPQGR